MARWIGVVATGVILLVGPAPGAGVQVAGAQVAGAEALKFNLPVELADRKVILRWNRAPGDTLTPDERLNDRSRLFGGYQVWRSTFDDPEHFELLRTYSLFDTTWTFAGTERIFADADSILARGCTGVPPAGGGFTCDPITGRAIAPFNGFFYYYALTWFEARVDIVGGSQRVQVFQMQTPGQGRLETPVEPAAHGVSRAPLLGKVHVVPNPFNPSDRAKRLQFGDENRVSFVGLPSPATVRIFTAAGDLVQVLENQDGNDTADWDLRNGNGDDVVGGLYLFQVDASNGALTKTGHFVIIR